MPRQKEHPYHTAQDFNLQHTCSSSGDPYRALWAAVLQSCVLGLKAKKKLILEIRQHGIEGARALHKGDKHAYGMITEAMKDLTWIVTEDCYKGSFPWVCQLLDMSSKMVSAKIMKEIGLNGNQ